MSTSVKPVYSKDNPFAADTGYTADNPFAPQPSAPPDRVEYLTGLPRGAITAFLRSALRGAFGFQLHPTQPSAPDPESKVPAATQLEGQREAMASEAEHPTASTVGRLTGVVASPLNELFPAAASLVTASRIPAAAISGGLGAGTVALANRQPGEGVASVIPDVALGAGLSTVLAGAGPLRQWAKGKYAEWKPDAAKIAASTARQANAADITDLEALAREAPEGGMVADIAGPNMAATFRSAIERSGAAGNPEGTLTRRALSERANKVRGSLPGEFASATGVAADEGLLAAKQKIVEDLKPSITAAYTKVMDANAHLDDIRLRALIDDGSPQMQSAVETALTRMEERGKPFLPNAAGKIQPKGLEFYDEVKQALDKQFRQGDAKEKGNVLKLLRPFRNQLDKIAGEDYAKARALVAERQAYLDATDLGMKFSRGSTDPRDAFTRLTSVLKSRKLSPEVEANAIKAFRKGAAREQLRMIGSAVNDEAALERLANTPNAIERARMAFGSDKAYKDFVEKSKELLRPLLVERAYSGEARAVRALEPDAFGRATPWSIAQALSGAPQLLLAQSAGTMMTKAAERAAKASAPILAKAARAPLKDAAGELSPELLQFLAMLKEPTVSRGGSLLSPRATTLPAIFSAGLLSQRQ